MDSVEDVFDHLLKETKSEQAKISLSEDKEFISITLSPNKKIHASNDMVEIYDKRKIQKLEYWTTTAHWHPQSYEDLYDGLLKYLL